MSRPRVLAAIAAWLMVVAVVSTLVWVVISRAGDELVGAQQPLVARTGDAGPQPTESSSPSAAELSPSASLDRSLERRTWQGAGGLIIAACDGGAVRLISAQPSDGYYAELKDAGPEELKVEFDARDDHGGNEIKVVARCVSGVPDFVAQIEDDD